MTGEFGPLDAREVQLALSKPDSGIEPVRRPAEKDADGVWRVRGLLVPRPGRWTVRIDVLVSDFEKVTLEDSVEFRRDGRELTVNGSYQEFELERAPPAR